MYKKSFATIEKSEFKELIIHNKLKSRINRLYHKNLVTKYYKIL